MCSVSITRKASAAKHTSNTNAACTAEWGAVMSEARDYLQKAPWIIVFNGLALFLVVTVFQLFGDRLSEFVHKKEARTEN